MTQNLTRKQLDELTYDVVGAAIEVHKIIGKRFIGKRVSPMYDRRVKT